MGEGQSMIQADLQYLRRHIARSDPKLKGSLSLPTRSRILGGIVIAFDTFSFQDDLKYQYIG